jgi:hypothetical protein
LEDSVYTGKLKKTPSISIDKKNMVKEAVEAIEKSKDLGEVSGKKKKAALA